VANILSGLSLTPKYYWNDEVKEDEMSRTKGNQVGKILLGRPRHRWEDEYEMGVTEI
jgi:hypothetical protein